jgi:UPF0755 protein
MKRFILIILAIIVVGAGIAAFIFLGPATGFNGKKEYLYIRTNAATKDAVMDSIRRRKIINRESIFNFVAERLNYWQKIRPGRYEIPQGASVIEIVRMLRNGRQSPVELVITKLRTKEDLARFTGRKFEFDSSDMLAFLNNNDSLAEYGVRAETAMFHVLPDTYTYFWNIGPGAVYKKLYAKSKKFWTKEREAKAASLGLTPVQVHILASIVEEETNKNEEKDTIASVYINRMKSGMPLGADPTIKFALKDFSIRWIHGTMLKVSSPYNTYINKGLPPGPICTPSEKTIDAVLAAPPTNYMYFVANSNFKGGHLFSSSYEEHLVKAKAYQQEDKRRREEREQSK